MKDLLASSSKGQLKIQQMAFVLVATMIFFALVFVFYTSVRFSSLKGDAEDLRKENVLESIRKISSTAEFAWTREDCEACIDMDKVLMLKDRESYQGFWKDVPLLRIERVHPTYSGEECSDQTYPECDKLTIINSSESNLVAFKSFVSLCRYEPSEKYYKCDLGKIVMAYEGIN